MNLTKALSYARQGINVFPCKPENKAPRTRNGFKDATTDAKKIRRWWKNNPNDLIGGLCDDTFTVIDVDCGGKCPDEQKEIILSVVDELKDEGVITDSTPCVRTMSGGFHYYLQTTTHFTRKINYLPAIDLLAKGGYVILPDGDKYVSLNHPLDVSRLEEIDYATITELHKKYDFTRKEVKYHIDLAEGKKPRKPTKPKQKKEREKVEHEDIDLYSPSDSKESIDPTISLLDDNGQIHIDAYTLDSDTLNMLFLNQEIQMKLGEYLGLRVPKKPAQTTLGHSILAGHADNNPSMGVRWVTKSTHLIARDFSDHYGDELTDYNVVRLYMNRMYGKQIRKPSKAEWTTWFMRLMYEAGLIKLDHVMYTDDLSGVFGDQEKKIKAAEHIFLLDAIKRLHSQYDEQFACTKKFMAAWCKDVHQNTSYLSLKELVAHGIIKHVQTNELSEKRNLFLYTIIHEDNKNEVKSVEEQKEEIKENRKKKSLPEIIKSRRALNKDQSNDEESEKMSKLEDWLRDDTNWDEPFDMAEADKEDGDDAWGSFYDNLEEDEDELNSDDKKPP